MTLKRTRPEVYAALSRAEDAHGLAFLRVKIRSSAIAQYEDFPNIDGGETVEVWITEIMQYVDEREREIAAREARRGRRATFWGTLLGAVIGAAAVVIAAWMTVRLTQ